MTGGGGCSRCERVDSRASPARAYERHRPVALPPSTTRGERAHADVLARGTNPHAADIDGDDIPDGADLCSTIPDDPPDTDDDRIGNACDRCPTPTRPTPTTCTTAPAPEPRPEEQRRHPARRRLRPHHPLLPRKPRRLRRHPRRPRSRRLAAPRPRRARSPATPVGPRTLRALRVCLTAPWSARRAAGGPPRL